MNMVGQDEARDIIERYDALNKQFNMNWKTRFLDIRDYILPRRGKFIEDRDNAEGGQPRHDKIIDSTAIRAIRVAAAGMQGGLTNQTMRWFRIVPSDVTMVRPGSRVSTWIERVEKMMYAILARSNFYTIIHTLYEEELGFGTGVILCEEDINKLVRFSICTAGEYRLANGYHGLVDCFYRLFYMNSKQMKDQFGIDKLNTDIQKDLRLNKPYGWHKVLHVVEPNNMRDDRKKDNQNMEFRSVYIDYDDGKTVMSDKGFNESPFAAARWATIGNEPYGVSPGHDALGSVKQLQVVTLAKMEAQEKLVSPPMQVPTWMKDVLDTRANGVNWVDIQNEGTITPLYQINFDINGTKADIADLRQEIRETFYNDLFMMLANSTSIQPKTATEVAALQEEKLFLLGPVVERQFHEVHDPVLSRVFNIALRNRLIPPPPAELAGSELKVEYISLLAEAQKRVGVSSVANTVAFITQLGQIIPAALDKLNVDGAVDVYAELYGAPTGIINDDEAVAKTRQQRQKLEEQIQQQQMVESLATGAKGVKDLAKSPMDEDNALTAIMGRAKGETVK